MKNHTWKKSQSHSKGIYKQAAKLIQPYTHTATGWSVTQGTDNIPYSTGLTKENTTEVSALKLSTATKYGAVKSWEAR